jgi:hypothetical protein
MTKIIKVSNPVANAVLEGRWEVAPHPNDVPVKGYAHPWISIIPARFKGNQIECSIIVDTSKLVANAVYTRQLLLQVNSEPATHTVTVEVHAGSVPAPPQKNLYAYLIGAIVLLAIEVVPTFSKLSWEVLLPRSGIIGFELLLLITVIAALLWFVMGARFWHYRRSMFDIFIALGAYHTATHIWTNILHNKFFHCQQKIQRPLKKMIF